MGLLRQLASTVLAAQLVVGTAWAESACPSNRKLDYGGALVDGADVQCTAHVLRLPIQRIAEEADVVLVGDAFMITGTPGAAVAPAVGQAIYTTSQDCPLTGAGVFATDTSPYLASLKSFPGHPQKAETWFKIRTDTMGFPQLAQPEFDANWIATTPQTYTAVKTWFDTDVSAYCAGGTPCRLVDEWFSGHATKNYVVAATHGNATIADNALYYIDQISDGGGFHNFTATGVALRLDLPAARAYLINRMRAMVADHNLDGIWLNHKLHIWCSSSDSVNGDATLDNYTNSPDYPDVTAWHNGLVSESANQGSGPIEGGNYSCGQYIQGLHALSQEMRAAGIPYAFLGVPAAWLADYVGFIVPPQSRYNYYDDRTTPAVNENQLIKEIIYGANLILTQPSTGRSFIEMKKDLQARNIRMFPFSVDNSLDRLTSTGLKVEHSCRPYTKRNVGGRRNGY